MWEGHAPLILYSPVSWLLALRMLSTDDALEPTVSTRSKPGVVCWLLTCSGRRFSSWARAPGFRAKGLRMGMMGDLYVVCWLVPSRHGVS